MARGLSSTPPPLETWLSTGTKSCQHVLDLHYIAALTHFPGYQPGTANPTLQPVRLGQRSWVTANELH